KAEAEQASQPVKIATTGSNASKPSTASAEANASKTAAAGAGCFVSGTERRCVRSCNGFTTAMIMPQKNQQVATFWEIETHNSAVNPEKFLICVGSFVLVSFPHLTADQRGDLVTLWIGAAARGTPENYGGYDLGGIYEGKHLKLRATLRDASK